MKESHSGFSGKLKILLATVVFSAYYFGHLQEIPKISLLNVLHGIWFVLLSNLVYAFRVVLMRKQQGLNFIEVVNYVNTINLIGLFLPFRVGDSIYFIFNKNSVISLRENYVFLVKMKIAELYVLFLIFGYVYFDQSIYAKFIFSLMLLTALFINFRELVLSGCQVGLICVFIATNLPLEEYPSIDLVIVSANYVLPILDMFIFSFGDVVLNELGLLPLSLAVSLRFYVAIGVVVTIILMKLYYLRI